MRLKTLLFPVNKFQKFEFSSPIEQEFLNYCYKNSPLELIHCFTLIGIDVSFSVFSNLYKWFIFK